MADKVCMDPSHLLSESQTLLSGRRNRCLKRSEPTGQKTLSGGYSFKQHVWLRGIQGNIRTKGSETDTQDVCSMLLILIIVDMHFKLSVWTVQTLMMAATQDLNVVFIRLMYFKCVFNVCRGADSPVGSLWRLQFVILSNWIICLLFCLPHLYQWGQAKQQEHLSVFICTGFTAGLLY